MNDPESSQTPRDIASEFAALAGLGALDGAEAEAMEHCHDCPFSLAARAALGHDEAIAALAAAEFPPIDPPADLKSTIMAKINSENKPSEQGGYFFIGENDGDWNPLPGGKIRLKVLSDLNENGHTLILLEASPGAVFFPHAHKGMEEVFLISGDLETEGRAMGPGDYLRAAPGTRHHKAISRNGCRALLVTARENHHRKAIGVYGGIMRSLAALKKKGSTDN